MSENDAKPERSDAQLRAALTRFVPERTELTNDLPPASKAFNEWLHRELRHRRGLDVDQDDDPSE